MRTPIMAGNWKMNMTIAEGVSLISELAEKIQGIKDVEVLVCPPFTALEAVGKAIGDAPISLGAQNIYPMANGAYTGEISPTMIKDLGCKYVIIGHSERREYFNESGGFLNEKVHAAIEFGLIPIICCGETLEERDSDRTFDKVGTQIDDAFKGVEEKHVGDIVVAYEPIWAIGTGRTASKEQAEEVHKFIRTKLARQFSPETADKVRIQYGGSVKPGNVDELMAMPDIDGALVGGASLKSEDFARIALFEK